MYAIADALEKHADELAYLECLNAGLVMRDVRASFGDTKQSGIGRDGRYSCAEFFSEEKTVSIPYAPLALHKLGAGD